MEKKREAVTLVIVAVAILALIAAYGVGSVDSHPASTASGAAATVLPPAAGALPIVAATGTHAASAVSSHAAILGPRTPSQKPRASGGNPEANPGCSGNCPMGITDYGLTSSLGTYSYKYIFAQSFFDSGAELGIGTANGGGCLDPDAAAGVCFTIQQNLVTQDMYHSGGYYWTQNVPEVAYDSSCSSPCVSGTFSVTFLDNIWNFSSSKGICPSGKDTGAGCINPAKIVGNGESDCSSSGGAPDLWYCVGPTVYDVTLPFTVTAATNVDYFSCASGDNCVDFYGSVESGDSILFGAYYDEVTFHMHDGSKAPFYEVQDKNSPVGLPEDFEWVLGGPGGGSGNTVEDFGDLQSFYCDSGCGSQANYHSIQNAWSSGYDTAEYVFDVYVVPEFNYRDAAELYFAADNPQTFVF